MAAQELRWLTYLLTDLGEPPRSPPVLYVDNKAMLALCREHRLEHRTKHIALRFFLARELQQRGQLRLAYMASEANTADIFTKALPPSDHQRFCTLLACFALLDWSCDLLFSPTLPMGQRGLLRLAYVASKADTADIFTKALPPGDHQRFCTMLACFALLDWSYDLLFSPTLPMGQRGLLRLAYVASEANTADIFTKALPPGDHQRLCTMLACFALLDWSCDLLFSPTLPMGVCQTYML
ncbi:unnamed protein product [Closterium sp. NIES-53]